MSRRTEPIGHLTGAQAKVMEQIWSSGAQGTSVAEIWQHLAAAGERSARTTVLTVIQRLEKRGWLRRIGSGRKLRFVATCDKEQALARLSRDFVDRFFSG